MKKFMNRKNTLIIICGLLIISLIVGVTYAFWSVNLNQEEENILSSGCFKIDFEDNGQFTLQNAFPISIIEGEQLDPYVFKITNSCSIDAAYQVNLEILNNSTLNSEYIRLMYDDDYTILIDKDHFEVVEPTLENAINAYKISEDILFTGESQTHKVSAWLDEDAPYSETNSKIFSFKITIVFSPITVDNTLVYQFSSNYRSSYFLNGDLTFDEIESITFVDSNVVPGDALGDFDVSDYQNGSIMAWYYDENEDGLYDLYIGQNGGVKAHQDSSYLFLDMISLKEINFNNNFDTSQVTVMNLMFSGIEVGNLDLTSFNNQKLSK